MMKRPVYRMRANESLVSGLAYLANLLPLWGILIAWAARESWRERSRHVVFHTTQAIWLQVALLLAFIAYAVIRLVGNLVGEIHATAGAILNRLNDWVLLLLVVLYVVACLALSWLTLDGRTILLPLLGPRIHRQEYEEGE